MKLFKVKTRDKKSVDKNILLLLSLY